ncbi:YbhB/YbcL family Raf kinase inhibitor-like protein [Undibacterium crateris]|uniref:YbhB/YbcL family Raf kinase inhibitor-like protein n=1 Tax=Undibacterium crateris TaxID=2528175 RepID=UPI00138A368C|nr:YbhB/YbcL family Raf kinase inhibitor-like protein [Undibacterium crateris]NDI87641.1 YbhB/YbcL family Raf kinase inhibitor-like protein [Undibacterium crateris]
MSKLSATLLSISLTGLSTILAGCGGSNAFADVPKFTASSNDLNSGTFDAKYIANGFGCSGGNVSPEIHWSNAPVGTKSFVVTVYDPDAPTGTGFYHWTVYNIPASTSALARGVGNAPDRLPAPAFGGANDFQDTGVTGVNGNYGGPCPPVGDKPHNYVITVWALDVSDIVAAGGVPKTGTSALYGFLLNRGLGAHVLGKAMFTATYGR